MAYFMGIDVGTQGSRAAVIDEDGSLVASGNGPHTLQSPLPGWSEQDQVGALLQPAVTGSESADLRFGHHGHRAEVEVLQALASG